MSRFKNFIQAVPDLEQFAQEAGTTGKYIRASLIGSYKCPRPPLWRGLVEASGGELTDQDLVDHFIHNNRDVLKEKEDAAA